MQILVLQNYLFFGNASSILAYISSMFEEPGEDIDPCFVPPIPKVVIIDFTLLTGMDTSSVDVFGEILTLCRMYDCKLFLAGVNSGLMKTMSLSGFKPDTAKIRSQRQIRFFSDLDNSVGKAGESQIHSLVAAQNSKATNRFLNSLVLRSFQMFRGHASATRRV